MASCITDFGYTTSAGSQSASIVNKAIVDAAIQTVVALWERNSSKSIANMQNELADRQTKLAEQVHAHAKIFWPEEAELVNDVFGETKVTTQYVGLMNGWGTFADIEAAANRANWIEIMTTRCTPPSQCEDTRWQRNAQVVRSDLMSYAARQDEARTQILNDRRYARQYAVLGLGKGQLRDLLSYQGIGNVVGLNASGMLTDTVNSALKTYGYISNRADVRGWGAGIRDTWTQTQQRAPLPGDN